MFTSSLSTALITMAICLAPFSVILMIVIYSKKRSSARRKNPITQYLLRSAGESVKAQLSDVDSELAMYLMMPPTISLFIYAYYSNLPSVKHPLILGAISGIILFGYILFKLIKLIKLREKLRLGYDAELAVGQELNTLMRHGYHVFHDVTLKNTISSFNIDHVVVGKTGVYAIETKGRSKPLFKNGGHQHRVNFDGKRLRFPGWSEEKPAEQATRQAQSLQQWLSHAVGEAVTVKAVIALPGWYVTHTQRSEIAVINGKNPERYFNAQRPENTSEKFIHQIAHQLENICRDIEPIALTKPKS
ncbi:nuclease-related domain-containing protein [Methylophilus sp. OH31]|uniref:nuclease-related domain-containing protein n=1 Tax=Methylophilus sp. OH31 TaxID=1387312 RepID=UPI001F584EDD|nr:nuclease-related domain-containing protein [Methylophilus sp. OH31]